MTVISVSITESSTQVVSGIPRSVTLSTNVSATIFYTLDGSDPTVLSDIYIEPIVFPTDALEVTLKVFASNGTDSSPIITETYTTSIVDNARLPHSGTTVPANSAIDSLYPYGTSPSQPEGNFVNPAEVGINVNDPNLTTYPNGYDGTATGTTNAETNLPYNVENYSIRYSATNAQGETGTGIGTLPANTTIQLDAGPPESSEQFTSTFDPKAFVIFQDFTKEDPNDPPVINKQHFTLENIETARDGAHYFITGLDTPPTSGTFLRSFFNPKDQTITYYYFDSWTNKWIISKTPYTPNGNFDGNLTNIHFSRGGAGRVFEWIPFARRVLF